MEVNLPSATKILNERRLFYESDIFQDHHPCTCIGNLMSELELSTIKKFLKSDYATSQIDVFQAMSIHEFHQYWKISVRVTQLLPS